MEADKKELFVGRSLLRHEREQRGWSQAKLAELIGSTPDNISRWERGLTNPSPYFREQLCILFEKHADELGLLPATMKKQKAQYEQEVKRSGIIDPLLPLLSAESKTLVGRETLLSQLVERCKNIPMSATTVLYGLPGVGKTALLCVLAQHRILREIFQGGILWAHLGTSARLTDHLSRWCRLLGVSTAELERVQEMENWVKLLRLVIGEQRVLLLVDDVWNLEDASLLLHIGGTNCAYVFTTRLPQLAIQMAGQENALSVPELSEEEGLTLLTRFVPTLVTQKSELVRSFLAQAGTLPLSLMLTGKYLAVQSYSKQPRRMHKALLTLQDAEQRLTMSLPHSLIDTSSSLMMDMPLSLKSVISLSDQRLSQAAQEALRVLCVLPTKPSSFSEEIAEALLTHSLDVLDELTDAGLIESNDAQRYTLHQTIADYARLDLKDDHASYKRLIDVGMSYLRTNAKDYRALEQEHDLLVVAMDVAHRLDQRQVLIQGCLLITPFLHAQQLYALATEYLQWAYEAAEREADDDALLVLSFQLGTAKEKEGDYEQAHQYLYRGLSIARHRKSKEQMSFLANLGLISMNCGQYIEAEEFLQEGLSLASRWSENNSLCLLLTYCGQLSIKQDNLEQAESYAQRGLALLASVEDAAKKCDLLRLVGMLHGIRGEYEQAQKYFLEGLHVARQAHCEEFISSLLRHLGRIAGRQGRYILAEGYYREALALSQQTGYFEQIALQQMSLGLLALQQGHDQQAEVYLQESLALARRLGHHELIAASLINIGDLAYEGKVYERAEQVFNEALAFVHQVNIYKEFLCLILCHLAMTKLKQNEYFQAERYLQEGIEVAKHAGTSDALCAALEAQGEYALSRHDFQQAAEAFGSMQGHAAKEDVLALSIAQYGLARVVAAQGRQREALEQGYAVLERWREMGYRRAREVQEWLRTLSVPAFSDEKASTYS